jgi:hypothetical protein
MSKSLLLPPASLFAACQDFVGQVGRGTLWVRPIVNRPAGITCNLEGSPSPFAACRHVGQPILAAAGFQPALAAGESLHVARKSRLKGGCRQDCLPHRSVV